MNPSTVLLLLLGFLPIILPAQTTEPDLEHSLWPAQWITVPDIDGKAYGVYLLRKEFELSAAPDSFPVYLSADNQYILYVNDTLVGRGPAKGDLDHWYYDRLDLAPQLSAGKNTLTVRVWNAGPYRQEAQISHQTALILQGATTAAAIVNTDESWYGRQDSSYRPVPVSVYGPRPGMVGMYGYYVAGPGDRRDMARRDGDWTAARSISRGVPKYTVGMDAREPWRLLPSPLPQMNRTPERFATVRRATGVDVPTGFLQGSDPLTIPARSTVSLLLDQSYLTNAFPTLTLGGGAGASLLLTYAEALYEDDLRTKNNRDEIDGKVILGRQDTIFTDGITFQSFTPLSYRTYRYVQLDIITEDEPLTVKDISAKAVSFPFELRAQLKSPQPLMDTLLEVGWRTARLCAMDTYMDCPYWEQLQYIGDTRIQALVTLYNTGDDRLVKHALDLMDYSRQPEGITLSRYPTNIKQIISPFSLWYVAMLHDYMRYGTDRTFIQDKLFGMRQVLDYFHRFQEADGSLHNLPDWAYTDWVNEWPRGEPPVDAAGHSAILDLQLLLAYQHGHDLETELGMDAFAELYRQRADQLAATVRKHYWNPARGLYADTGDQREYSQHANSLAILAGLVPDGELESVGHRILEDTSLTPASIYFKYYVHRALVRAGLGDDYLDWLGIWQQNLDLGLTTWAEQPNPATSRSDCHAWGSSPNIEFYRTVLGIDSASPHFRTVRIEPHLGEIKRISGEMPHPAGTISVSYERVGDEGLEAVIELPKDIKGTVVWKGKVVDLQAGRNTLQF